MGWRDGGGKMFLGTKFFSTAMRACRFIRVLQRYNSIYPWPWYFLFFSGKIGSWNLFFSNNLPDPRPPPPHPYTITIKESLPKESYMYPGPCYSSILTAKTWSDDVDAHLIWAFNVRILPGETFSPGAIQCFFLTYSRTQCWAFHAKRFLSTFNRKKKSSLFYLIFVKFKWQSLEELMKCPTLFSVVFYYLTHLSLASYKRDIGKQGRPRSGAV